MQKLTEVLRLRVQPSLYKKLVNLAKWDKRDLSDYIRLMLEEGVKEKEHYPR